MTMAKSAVAGLKAAGSDGCALRVTITDGDSGSGSADPAAAAPLHVLRLRSRPTRRCPARPITFRSRSSLEQYENQAAAVKLPLGVAMEKEKLSFSIPSKARPPRPTSHPAATAVDDDEYFVTEFNPIQTLATGSTPAVIAPLQNSGHFLNHRSRKPSSLPSPEEEAALAVSAAGGPSFVLDTSTAPPSTGSP
uniref:Uncharacterized protein n=1 Tax=Leersia perrieri TaxID=77586 RepID=A0A0D9WLW1_9ORYZ